MHQNTKTGLLAFGIVATIAVMLGGVLLVAANRSAPGRPGSQSAGPSAAANGPSVRYTTKQLGALYEADELAADRDLTGRVIEVTGAVQSSTGRGLVLQVPFDVPYNPNPVPIEEVYNQVAGNALAAAARRLQTVRVDGVKGAGSYRAGQVLSIRGTYRGRGPNREGILADAAVVSR